MRSTCTLAIAFPFISAANLNATRSWRSARSRSTSASACRNLAAVSSCEKGVGLIKTKCSWLIETKRLMD